VRGRERRAQDLRRTGKVNVLGKNDDRSMLRYTVSASWYFFCFDSSLR
jgi:hypothetical protein